MSVYTQYLNTRAKQMGLVRRFYGFEPNWMLLRRILKAQHDNSTF